MKTSVMESNVFNIAPVLNISRDFCALQIIPSPAHITSLCVSSVVEWYQYVKHEEKNVLWDWCKEAQWQAHKKGSQRCQKSCQMGFPGGAVVGNLPANAGDTGFEPWSGRIPHAAEQLGPWATTTEPARLEPVLRNGGGHDSERPAHRDEEWPPLTTAGESPRTETKTQHSQK